MTHSIQFSLFWFIYPDSINQNQVYFFNSYPFIQPKENPKNQNTMDLFLLSSCLVLFGWHVCLFVCLKIFCSNLVQNNNNTQADRSFRNFFFIEEKWKKFHFFLENMLLGCENGNQKPTNRPCYVDNNFFFNSFRKIIQAKFYIGYE